MGLLNIFKAVERNFGFEQFVAMILRTLQSGQTTLVIVSGIKTPPAHGASKPADRTGTHNARCRRREKVRTGTTTPALRGRMASAGQRNL